MLLLSWRSVRSVMVHTSSGTLVRPMPVRSRRPPRPLALSMREMTSPGVMVRPCRQGSSSLVAGSPALTNFLVSSFQSIVWPDGGWLEVGAGGAGVSSRRVCCP